MELGIRGSTMTLKSHVSTEELSEILDELSNISFNLTNQIYPLSSLEQFKDDQHIEDAINAIILAKSILRKIVKGS